MTGSISTVLVHADSELAALRLHDVEVEQLGATGALLGIHLEHSTDHSLDVGRVLVVYGRVCALEDSLVQSIHVIGSKWWLQRHHFVADTAQGPNVALGSVGLVSPHLWTGIIWGTCLRVKQTLLGYFRNVQVSQLGCTIFLQEYIGTFQISMQDVSSVECLESLDYLDEDEPDALLVNVLLVFLMFDYLLVEVSIVEEVHHKAETGRGILKKGLFVTDYAIMTIKMRKEIKISKHQVSLGQSE